MEDNQKHSYLMPDEFQIVRNVFEGICTKNLANTFEEAINLCRELTKVPVSVINEALNMKESLENDDFRQSEQLSENDQKSERNLSENNNVLIEDKEGVCNEDLSKNVEYLSKSEIKIVKNVIEGIQIKNLVISYEEALNLCSYLTKIPIEIIKKVSEMQSESISDNNLENIVKNCDKELLETRDSFYKCGKYSQHNLSSAEIKIIKNVYKGIKKRHIANSTNEAISLCSFLTKVPVDTVFELLKKSHKEKHIENNPNIVNLQKSCQYEPEIELKVSNNNIVTNLKSIVPNLTEREIKIITNVYEGIVHKNLAKTSQEAIELCSFLTKVPESIVSKIIGRNNNCDENSHKECIETEMEESSLSDSEVDSENESENSDFFVSPTELLALQHNSEDIVENAINNDNMDNGNEENKSILIENVKEEPNFDFFGKESDVETQHRLSGLSLAMMSETWSSFPEHSRQKYEIAFKRFLDWRKQKSVTTFCEETLLLYFEELAQTLKASTLYWHYSMLRTALGACHNIDLSTYLKLRAFLRHRAHIHIAKKTETLTSEEIDIFLREAPDSKYLLTKVALVIGITGACKREELCKLRIDDLEDLQTALIVRIPNRTVKKSRMFTITGRFYEIYKKYARLRPQTDEKRFFLNYQKGKCTKQTVGINKFGNMPREIATFLKLPNPEHYTGRCFRSSSANIDHVNIQMKHESGYENRYFQQEQKMEIL